MSDGAEDLVAELVAQLDQMRNRVELLSAAVVDIQRVAEDYIDLGRNDLSSILHVCLRRSVVAAMGQPA